MPSRESKGRGRSLRLRRHISDDELLAVRAQPIPGRAAAALSWNSVLDPGKTPAPHPFRSRPSSRTSTSPAGAQRPRPAAQPLPAAGRAASETLLHEVDSLLAEGRALRLLRKG